MFRASYIVQTIHAIVKDGSDNNRLFGDMLLSILSFSTILLFHLCDVVINRYEINFAVFSSIKKLVPRRRRKNNCVAAINSVERQILSTLCLNIVPYGAEIFRHPIPSHWW